MTLQAFDSREALVRLASGDRAVPRSLFDPRMRSVLYYAATVNLPATLRAAGTFLRGKRVRGWNALCGLANRHAGWLAHWRSAHRAALVAGLQSIVTDQNLRPARLAAVIAGTPPDPGAVARTIRNLSDVLGETLVTALCQDAGGAHCDDVETLAQQHWDWLLVLRPGDTIDTPFPAMVRLLAADSSGRAAWFWDCDDGHAAEATNLTIKPDWDPVLDRSMDLLAGSLIVARKVFEGVRASQKGCMDALSLVTELCAAVRANIGGPGHLPGLLGCAGSTMVRPAPLPALPSSACPPVSIIVLTRDRSDLVIPLFAMLDRLDYAGPVERIVVDNGSSEPELIEFLRAREGQGSLRWLRRPGPFNFAALNNEAAAESSGELLCLLNNDIEPLDDGWLSRMVIAACNPATGAVGAMLTYPNGAIQHAGVALGIGGAAGHIQRHVDPADPRLANWHAMSRRVEAVTAACMVVRKALFESVGGFDETTFPVAFNDVDLCLRFQEAGLHNVYEAGARLVHHESLSRGADDRPENIDRFAAELAALRRRWNTETRQDPYWSPLFSRTSERCLLIP